MPHVSRGSRLHAGAAFVLLLAASPAALRAQGTASASPVATPDVRCVDVAPGAERPPFGCFNIGHRSGLTFADTLVVWRLFRFESRAAADAARGARGVVAAEAGAVWLSEVADAGSRAATPAGGTLVAESGPLALPPAPSYDVAWAYAVFQPGMRSRVHTHAGPEAFYVLAGEQCVETPAGAQRTAAGGMASLPAGVPMALSATGREVRRGFALVVHDGRHPQAEGTPWQPAGACAR